MSKVALPHLHVTSQISGFSQKWSSHLENLIDRPNPQVSQSCVLPPLSSLPYRETSFVRLSTSSPVCEGHVDEQLSMWKVLPCEALEGYMPVARLEALQWYSILTCSSKDILFYSCRIFPDNTISKRYEFIHL